MKSDVSFSLTATSCGTLVRARVIEADGRAVRCEASGIELTCEVLASCELQGALQPDDRVLVHVPLCADEMGIVIGRIGAPTESREDTDDGSTRQASPDELLIEARRSLTLRVGDNSITIRSDGKILIKGRDLVTQATRRNRIRGGSVEIN